MKTDVYIALDTLFEIRGLLDLLHMASADLADPNITKALQCGINAAAAKVDRAKETLQKIADAA